MKEEEPVNIQVFMTMRDVGDIPWNNEQQSKS